MKRFLLVFTAQLSIVIMAFSQSLNVGDMLTLSVTPSEKIDNFLRKKGFVLAGTLPHGEITTIQFNKKKKHNPTS